MANEKINMILHRAPFVVPVSSPVIENGAVLCCDNKIIAVDKFSNLKGEHVRVVDHQEHVLIPALVNAHCHLELSCLSQLAKDRKTISSYVDWIKQLTSLCQKPRKEDDILRQGVEALKLLENSGCCLIADIGNTSIGKSIADKSKKAEVLFFYEVLGLAEKSIAENLSSTLNNKDLITAHAPHSTNPETIKQLKERADLLGHIFSIHLAESREELQLLADSSGPFREFIEERGGWDNSFKAPECGPVEYLEKLGVLDQKTLAVHLVQVTDKEIEILAERCVKTCICPGSNKFLGTGKSPVQKFLKAGILPAIGTDSLASNPELNIWNEMSIMAYQNPEVDREIIFKMATLGGAEALHSENKYGSLSQGKTDKFLAVEISKPRVKTIFEQLVNMDSNARLQWIQ
jgi:aminodeoxyfutalosine deaminase